VGLEHEFVVRRNGDQVDFRDLIHTLGVPGRRVDPGDHHAYRTRSGLMLTCDGPEAEIATPPVALSRGFVEELETWAGAGAQLLTSILPVDLEVEGCSTHLSVSVAEDVNTAVCRLFAHTFSPALMLLMDDRDSPGLLIRPRPGRVELGGEYATGASLRAAVMLAVGGVRACTHFYRRRIHRPLLPYRLDVKVQPALERFGWYVDRRAFGVDLYADGRKSELRTADGGAVSAQQQLESAWAVAVSHLEDEVTIEEAEEASRLVHGLTPLPVEIEPSRDPLPVAGALASDYGRVLKPIVRPAFAAEVTAATWDVTILRLTGPRAAYAAIPRRYLSSFLRAVRAGRLDDSIGTYLATPPTGRRLESHDQAVKAPAFYDEIGWAPALLAPERGWDGVPRAQVQPGSSNPPGGSAQTGELQTRPVEPGTEETADRPGKGLGPPLTQPPPPEPPPPPPPWWRSLRWLIGITAALAVVVIAFLALSGGSTPEPDAGTGTGSGTGTATEPTTGTGTGTGTATEPTTGTGSGSGAATTSTVGATTTTMVKPIGTLLPFDHAICELSEPSGVSVVDCAPELAVTVLTARSPAGSELAITVETETGLLAGDAPNSSISLRMFGPGGELYECFVRGTGEAMCRAFFGGSVPAGAGPPRWDPATNTYSVDGLRWDGGTLSWHGVPIASVDMFLRSRVDPNRTITIALDSGLVGHVLEGTV
jgi:hypothetical protein